MQEHRGNATVRPAAVAGQFYPRDPDLLRSQITELLAKAPDALLSNPKALIVPHAGYAYSGHIAGLAFAMLAHAAAFVTRVVVIGPAHYVPLRGIAIPTVEAFETPLGRVPVDQDALSGVSAFPFAVRADEPHEPEHAIEVELPFLQRVLQAFTLVPLLVGDADPKEVAEAIGRLWGGPEIVIVISSDLSHFHDHRTAQRLDLKTAAAIEQGDWEQIRPLHACGSLAIAGLLQQTAVRGLTAQRIGLWNSADMGGPQERVVGYGAWGFADKFWADKA